MAAIDTSIYGQIQPIQIDSPVNALAKVSAVKNAENQNRLFDMKVADRESERASNAAMNEAYRSATNPDGTIDRNKLFTSIASGGHGSKLPSIQKGLADSDKAGYEATKSKYESIIQKTDLVARTLAPALQNPALYPQLLAKLRAETGGGQDMPEQFDPRIVQSTIQMALSTKDRADQEWKQRDFDYKRSNDAANRGVTIRGQNMTDSRARQTSNEGRAPSGYRFTADGSLEPIKGGPADPGNKSAKATTEGEKASAGYGLRMVEAEKIIDAVGAKNPKSQKPGILERVAGDSGFANLTRDNDRQQYRQAQEDWVRSKLRKESGAAIPSDEMDREIQTYFPQIGEKADVIEQKRRSRATATKAMGIAAGGAEPQMRSGSGAPASNIDSLLDKYK